MSFVDAAACGDHGEIKAMLADPATTREQINALDKDGRSAFHYACLNDDVPLFKVLVADPRVDVELRSPKGDVCVHLSALYASLEVLKLMFLDARACKLVSAQNNYGETPLHLTAGSGDKGAARAAGLLLEAGASLLLKDKWGRGPVDVAHDNGENALVGVFAAFLAKQPADLQAHVQALTAEYLAHKNERATVPEERKQEHAKMIFGGLGGALKGLKKTQTQEKTMFSKQEGAAGANKAATAATPGRVLSKLIDFPGDVEEIKKHLASGVPATGRDAFSLTALMKFASWNKVELMDLILPLLTAKDVNEQDAEGKTALHWAVEMASVGAVQKLVAIKDVDTELRDVKGRTAMDILDQAAPSAIIDRIRGALRGGASGPAA